MKILIAILFILPGINNCDAQIIRGNKSDTIDNRYLVLLQYYSLEPVERINFATQYFKRDFQSPELFNIIKNDLDGLSGVNSGNFLGIGYTGPIITNSEMFSQAKLNWNYSFEEKTYLSDTNSMNIRVYADSISEESFYMLLNTYCQNSIFARIQFSQLLSTIKPYNILFIKLIKVDLDTLTRSYNPEIIDDELKYVDIYLWNQCLQNWTESLESLR